MERTKVKSSIIKSIGYDDKTRLLEIEFCSGNTGRFINISEETYIKLMSAPSIGKYFIQYIRDRYPQSVRGIVRKKKVIL